MPVETEAKPLGNRGAQYIRVSDERQETERQHEAIKEWLNQKKLVATQVFEDRGGRRHRSDKRADFQRMLRAIRAGEIDWIVVDTMERLGFQGARQFQAFLYEFDAHKVQLWEASSGKELTSDDEITNLLNTVGALSSSKTMVLKAQHDLNKKKLMAKSGEWVGGYVPYGCDVECRRPDGSLRWRVIIDGHWKRIKRMPDGSEERFDGKDNFPRERSDEDTLKLVPSCVEERIKTIQNVFTWYATEKISLRGLATRLNTMGVVPLTVEGGWYAMLIKGILSNPVYIGLPTYNKNAHGFYAEIGDDGRVKAGAPKHAKSNLLPKTGRRRDKKDWIQPDKPIFPPIVSKELFDAVQLKLDDITVPKRNSRNANLWLSGLLYCGGCGARMVGWTQKQEKNPLSYCCSSYRKGGNANKFGCRLNRINHHKVEAIIKQYLEEIQVSLRAFGKQDFSDSLNPLYASYSSLVAENLSLYAMIEEALYEGLSSQFKFKDFEVQRTEETEWPTEQIPWREFSIPSKGKTVKVRFRREAPSVDTGIPVNPLYFRRFRYWTDGVFGKERFEGEREIFGSVLAQRQAVATTKLAEAEAKFAKLYRKFDELDSPMAKRMCQEEMRETEQLITRLQSESVPFADQIRAWGDRMSALGDRIGQVATIFESSGNLQKAEALSGILEEIRLHFEPRDHGQQKRSVLVFADFIPLDNLKDHTIRLSFPNEGPQGQTFTAKAFYRRIFVR